MALKETLEVISTFGYASGTVCAGMCARDLWEAFGPGGAKFELGPETKAQMAKTNEMMKKLGIPVRDLALK